MYAAADARVGAPGADADAQLRGGDDVADARLGHHQRVFRGGCGLT
jgi:hypothetical protein